MITRPRALFAEPSTWLAALIFCGLCALAWFGYRATEQWQRSAALLADHRGREAADLLTRALTRDMAGVQTSILNSPEQNRHAFDPPYEANDLVALAFARYPYPEFFFGWTPSSGGTVMFARTDRLPAWITPVQRADVYPVEVRRDPPEIAALRRRVESDVAARRRYSVFDISIEGTPYQVVALLAYEGTTRERLDRIFGAAVNLDWARDHYFNDILQQVAQIAGNAGADIIRGDRRTGPSRRGHAGTGLARDSRYARLSALVLRSHTARRQSARGSRAAVVDRCHQRRRRPDLRARGARRAAKPRRRRRRCRSACAEPSRYRPRRSGERRRRDGPRRFRCHGHPRAEDSALDHSSSRRDAGARTRQDRPGPEPVRASARARGEAPDAAGEQPARLLPRDRRHGGLFVRSARTGSAHFRSDARIPPATDRQRRSARNRRAAGSAGGPGRSNRRHSRARQSDRQCDSPFWRGKNSIRASVGRGGSRAFRRHRSRCGHSRRRPPAGQAAVRPREDDAGALATDWASPSSTASPPITVARSRLRARLAAGPRRR